jgi:hypothetical protein
VVVKPWPDSSWYNDDLPAYLSEPEVARDSGLQRFRSSLVRTQRWATTVGSGHAAAGSGHSAAGGGMPLGGQSPRQSPVFFRMVPLNRSRLPSTLDVWWSTRSRSGAVNVQRRLRLGPPECNGAAGWLMRGRVRRLTTFHWVPVVVELWPVHADFARMTMTPEGNVMASRRYFRLGHYVLDHLSADLIGSTPVD